MEESSRRAALRLLSATSDTRFGRSYFVTYLRQTVGGSTGDAWELLWGLVGDGLVYIDQAGQPAPDNWYWRLSAEGRRVADGGEWEPRDPDGYLARLRGDVQDLDPLIDMYLVEAVGSFNAGRYLASSVMLGVAAERAFLVTVESYAASSIAGAAQMKREIDRRGSQYFTLWMEFRKRIEPVRPALPEGLADALTLDAIADLIRLTRNDVGHPTGRIVDEDTARVHLTI